MRQFITLPMVIVLIGALCSAFGALWTTARQAEERARSADARAQAEKDLREKSDVIADLHRQSAEARTQAEKELREKSDEIARLNKRVADLVTGGDGFCFVHIAGRQVGLLSTSVINPSDTPLYNIAGRVLDLAEHKKLRSEGKEPTFFDTAFEFRVGDLGAHQATMIKDFDFSTGDAKDYNIIITARNGLITQLLRGRRTLSGWRIATRVIRNTGREEILYEQVDDEFPRGPNGEIPWE